MFPKLLRLRVPLGFALAAWYLVIAKPTSKWAYAFCLLFVVVGCALRSWAAGFLLKGKRVAVGGPYAYVRNPLYLGSFLIGMGFCGVLWHQPLPWNVLTLWVGYGVGFGVVYPLKARAEEGELTAALGEPYLRYAAAVPAYLPWRGHVGGLGDQVFSKELYQRNKEYECIVGSVLLMTYLTLRLLNVF